MTLDIRAGMTPAQLAKLTPGSLIVFGAEFGDSVAGPNALAVAGKRIPYAYVITAAYIWANASGSAVVDVETSTDAVTWTTICSTNKLTLTAAQLATSTLTLWTLSIAAGQFIRFQLDSVSGLLGVYTAIYATRA